MSIDRSAYSDPTVFDEEMLRLFGARMYAGSLFDLPAANDYRSLLVGGHAITLRNTPEGVRAFNNVCLHRNALIDPPGSGNRAFRCNYHGWSYGDDGALKHAPLADEGAICERRLAGYSVAESKGLYFVGQRGVPDVSDVTLAFDETNTVLAEPFCRGVLDHACNWKLLVENVLESYHLSYVHKDTFVPAGFTSTADYRYGMWGGVSWSVMTPRHIDDRSQSYRRIAPTASHHYQHAFVFPNFFLANSNGLVGFHSSLQPSSATTTRLEWCLFELPALAVLATPIRDHFRKDAITFANATLLEDKALVESCQLGLSSFGTACQFQPNEERIAHFHSMYRERMGAASD
jgi:phenylpropionate dioxygenase-like ring-hydroxylating dioxygenase large terminal subunit